MDRLYSQLQRHRKTLWIIITVYLILAGYVNFPMQLTFSISLLLINLFQLCTMIIVGIVFSCIVSKGLFKVFGIVMGSSALGLLGHYVLGLMRESDSVEFTFFNIILYLVIVSLVTIIAYLISSRKLNSIDIEEDNKKRNDYHVSS